MIEGLSATTDEANTETMLVTGEPIPGEGMIVTNLFYNDLTAPQKIVYDEAMPIVTGSYYTTITNTTAELKINRVTDDVLVEAPATIDFESLSEADKDKLRALLALFVELSE
jgi:hypothetical protein